MAINYATKYSSKIAERFKKGSITNAGAGHDYSFVGAKTVKVSTVDVVPLNDFNRTAGSNRFGEVTNLGDVVQEMTMTQDKSFVFAIDAGDASDVAIEMAAGKALRREIDEVVNPAIDKYRLQKWVDGGTEVKAGSTTKLTKSTILPAIIAAGGAMSNELVPEGGRTLYIPNRNYQLLVQADAVVQISAADMAKGAVEKGVVGMVDNCKVVRVPAKRLPEGFGFMIAHPSATVAPNKLNEFNVHLTPPGVSGNLIEGRVVYDAFVLDNKKKGIYYQAITTAAEDPEVDPGTTPEDTPEDTPESGAESAE
jgi:hypothetical protein